MMIRIAKLTWLHNGNYGTVLQAFALQKFLLQNGYITEDLDYKANSKAKLWNYLANRNSPELLFGKIKDYLGKKNSAYSEQFAERTNKIETFISNNMILSQQFHSPKEIAKVAGDYDIFICGSDQIWSPYLLNPVFYLRFLPREKLRISYATSFGVTATTAVKERKIRSYLKDFQFVSVRESQGQEFVEKITGEKVPVCIDPTMLLTEKDWLPYIKHVPSERRYIFAFLLTPNHVYENEIREFAQEKGLDVYIVPTIQGPFETGFNERIATGPDEWMGYIKNAEYVFTDSFHAFVFSLLFQKEVYIFKRFSDNQKRSQNSRIYSLTKILDLQSRIIDSGNLAQIYQSNPIDYDTVNQRINNEAKKSAEWLRNSIEKATDIISNEQK